MTVLLTLVVDNAPQSSNTTVWIYEDVFAFLVESVSKAATGRIPVTRIGENVRDFRDASKDFDVSL